MTADNDAAIATADEQWRRASKFVRDILSAVGVNGHDLRDYPPGAWVDLEALTLEVVGQIEEYKTRLSKVSAERDALLAAHAELQELVSKTRTRIAEIEKQVDDLMSAGDDR